MNARFYMPELGRFMQHDPLSSSTLEPYGYGYNNPVLFADPTGLDPKCPPDCSIPPYSPGGTNNPINIGEIVIPAPGNPGGGYGGPYGSYPWGGYGYGDYSPDGYCGFCSSGSSSGYNPYAKEREKNTLGWLGIGNVDRFHATSGRGIGNSIGRSSLSQRPPFSTSEINELVGAGLMTSTTAEGLLGAGTSSAMTWGTFATVLTRAVAIGALLSIKDEAPPSRYYVYMIKGSNTSEFAKIGITRQNDPTNRPQSQIKGLNARYSGFASHTWSFLQGPVSRESALLYEKYYVWEYNQQMGKMPYAQSYPYPDALTRYLEKIIYKR